MQKLILPRQDASIGGIEIMSPMDDLVIGTTTGLIKKMNEDRVGYSISSKKVRICVADGHWGNDASKLIVNYWLDDIKSLNEQDSVTKVMDLQKELFVRHEKQNMNEDSDFTPEASFIVVEIDDRVAKVVSYGDCRMFIARSGKIFYEQEKKETWLGAFSHLGMRSRIPVSEAVVFQELDLETGDTLVIFTDGVDQCKYGKDTIRLSEIVSLVTNNEPIDSLNAIMGLVVNNGAEDNASLAIYRV